jgi:Polyketide cyclase / dehydrase and lipid transport
MEIEQTREIARVTRAYFSARLDADIERTWTVVGDFHGVATWISGIESCIPRGEFGPGEVGAIREVTTSRGATLQERLVAYDDRDHSYSYEFVGTIPYPVSTYRGTAHLLPIVEDGTTFIEWFGDFEAERDIREDVKRRLEKLYTVFIGDVRRRLTGP